MEGRSDYSICLRTGDLTSSFRFAFRFRDNNPGLCSTAMEVDEARQEAVQQQTVERIDVDAEQSEAAAVKGKRGRPKRIPGAPKQNKAAAVATPAAGAPGTSSFPISRVAKIVKADKDIAMCQKEAIFLMSVATVRSGHASEDDSVLTRLSI